MSQSWLQIRFNKKGTARQQGARLRGSGRTKGIDFGAEECSQIYNLKCMHNECVCSQRLSASHNTRTCPAAATTATDACGKYKKKEKKSEERDEKEGTKPSTRPLSSTQLNKILNL